MNIPKDVLLCGACKTIFSDIKLFLNHKSTCLLPQKHKGSSSSAQPSLFENGLFTDQTVLELTLENEYLPLELQYDNEEVVSDNNPFILGDASPTEDQLSTEDQFDQMLASNKMINDINEEEVAKLLVMQLPKKVINNEDKHPLNNLETGGKTIEVADSKQLNRVLKQPVMKYSSNKKLDKEIQGLDKKQRNICDVCNYTTVYNKVLIRHMRKHTGERPYTCCFCDKKFARQDKLVTHKRIHTGDKRYKCQQCEYACTDGGALRKHLRVHTDERPHKCQMCSYQAKSLSHMIVHLRTHTGDSPFFCGLETCGRTFKTSTDLKRHMKIHKLVNLSPTYSSFDDTTENHSCNHIFPNDKKLSKQLSSCYMCQDSSHNGVASNKRRSKKSRKLRVSCIRAHECPHCNAAFVRQDSLRSHLKLHQRSTPSPNQLVELDEEELGQDHDLARSPLPELSSSSDCMQGSLTPLYQDNSVNCIIDSPFL